MNRLSDRDRKILEAECADVIASLRPITTMPGWRETFEKEALRWRAVANGRPESSEARREALSYANAHRLLLDEDPERI